MSRHKAYRRITRITLRSRSRCLNRSSLRGRRRGPDDLAQALTSFSRAIRAYRRLARLAPSFFDAAVRDREAENRAEQRRWMTAWEPYIAKAYGVEPRPPVVADQLPMLPSPRIQRKVEFKLAEREMCMLAGRAALERYHQRRPHDGMSLSRMARLLEIGFDLKRLACGMDIQNPLPEKISYDYELTGLKRGYGYLLDPAPPIPQSPAPETSPPVPVPGDAGGTALAVNHDLPSVGEPALDPPVDHRCDAWSRWARQLRGRNR